MNFFQGKKDCDCAFVSISVFTTVTLFQMTKIDLMTSVNLLSLPFSLSLSKLAHSKAVTLLPIYHSKIQPTHLVYSLNLY